MDFSKLTRAHIWIIGLVITVILGAGFYFLGISKTNQNLATLKQRKDTADGTIAKEPQYQADLRQAKQEVAEAERAFRVFTNTKMPKPPIDLRNPDATQQVKAMMNLWQEPRRLYDLAQNFALSTDAVAVRTQFGVPAPPADPRLIPTTIIEIPLGTVTAHGDLKSILDYMRRWNQFSRVVAVDNLQLTGTSPLLTGTATLTAYIFPVVNPGQEQPAAADPGGGYGGGYPGGYGGPPGGAGYGGPPGGPGGAPNGP